MVRRFVNDDLGNVWKKMVVAYFKVLYQILFQGAVKTHESPPL